MSIKGKENMEISVYDSVENGRSVRKIVMKHAEILTGTFRDFIGTVNAKGTLIRKITVAVPLRLTEYLKENGIPVGRWVPDGTSDDEINDYDALVTIKINYSYRPPYIEAKLGEDGIPVEIPETNIHTLQTKQFDDAMLTGTLSNGVYMNRPYTSIYLNRASLTVHKPEENQFEKEMYDEYGSRYGKSAGPIDEPEELPF